MSRCSWLRSQSRSAPRRFSLTAVTIAAVALAGCTPGTSSKVANTAPPSGGVVTDPAKLGNVTVHVLDYFTGGVDNSWMSQVVKQFQAKYPNIKVLDTTRPSVGVLLRRAIAQSRTHAGHMPDSLAELEERLNVSAQRGERTHLREEARLALEFPHDGADGRQAALALARDNFNVQRETEDIRLFARAVVVTRDPAALATLKEWLQHSHYEDIVVAQLLRSGQPS